MQKTLRKKAQIYKLKVLKKGTVWFHVGKENSYTDYLEINSITESFEIGEEYYVLAVKEESYSARWGRKTYYYAITEEDAAKLEIDIDINNARKKLNKCKSNNKLSKSIKNSIIKLAHSDEVILKELEEFEEKLKNDNTNSVSDDILTTSKEYSIETIPYISDKNNNKCIVGDKVVVCKKNGDIIIGNINSFKDESFLLDTLGMPLTMDIGVKDISSLKKIV